MSGDLDGAEQLLQSLQALGQLGSRLRTLSVLLPLARGQAEAAEGALVRLDQVTVRGERDALTALVQAAAGRPELAASAWRAAGARNPIFTDPARAAHVLIWRSDAVAALTAALAAAAGTGEGSAAEVTAGEGSGAALAAASPPVPQAEPHSGCCRTASGAGPSPAAWLLLAVGGLWLRRRV